MLVEQFFNAFFSIISITLDKLPVISIPGWDAIMSAIASGFLNTVFDFTGYFLPMQLFAMIITAEIAFQLVRFSFAVLDRVKGFIPGMGGT